MKERVQSLRKNKSIIAIIGGFFVLILFFGLISGVYREKFVVIGEEKIFVDIAATDSEREKGLSGQEYLCDACGLLFLFDSPDIYSFWMKDMQFDIDIVWIRNNRIVHLSRNLDHVNGEQERVQSLEEVDAVLEVSAGTIDQKELQIGQAVAYPKNAFEQIMFMLYYSVMYRNY